MFLKEEVEKPIGSLIRNHYHLRYHTETELSVQPFVWTNAMMMCLFCSLLRHLIKSQKCLILNVMFVCLHLFLLANYSAYELTCLILNVPRKNLNK